MATGDGLLVRLRPQSGAFTPRAFLALLDAAERFGNGRLDVTARGNLQIRGLTADSVAPFAEALDAAGIVPVKGTAIETPPLAGFDPSEIADPRPLARALSARLPESGLRLAPKLSIVVDGGGLLHLGAMPADLRLEARARENGIVWGLSLAGSRASATFVAAGGEAEILESAMLALHRLAALGPAARGRDLDVGRLRGDMPAGSCTPLSPLAWPAAPSPAGSLRVGDGIVLGLAPAFGQMEAKAARAITRLAMDEDLQAARLAPGRSLLFLGLTAMAAGRVAARANAGGFLCDPADPALRIDACAGAGACASAGIDTQSAARLLMAEAPVLFDGSLDIHVSGCAKGCARPRASFLTLVAAPGGYGLVLEGTAADAPAARTGRATVRPSVSGLGRLVQETKHGGESAASCLKRLGPARIAAAFRRD